MTQEEPSQPASMPFVGLPTFLKLPVTTPETAKDQDFVILGVPFDEAVTNRPGARFGPRAIRSASTLYSYEGSPELFDVELGRTILEGARVADAGDVAIQPLGAEKNRTAITGAVSSLLEAGALPVCLGGDHSITASILEAHAQGRRPRLSPAGSHRDARPQDPLPFLLHLDAHMDFDSYLSPFAHGTPVRIAVERGLVSGVLQVGVRGLNSGRADWEQARAAGVQVVTAADLRRLGAYETARRVPPGVPLYLSLDIDVFDPGTAPGTGTPEPGGLSYREVVEVLQAVSLSHSVVGLDLVEVNPLFDHGEITSVLAARLLLDVMGQIWAARGPARPRVPA
jgi:agmatinase